MTEFEAAQLVYMQSERAVNLISLVHAQGELIQNDATQFTTLLFGYLLVAYFIGLNLSRIQVTILNVLYAASIGATIFQMVVGSLAAIGFLNRFYELTDATREVTVVNPNYLAFAICLNFGLVLASFYFMWSVRHPRAK